MSTLRTPSMPFSMLITLPCMVSQLPRGMLSNCTSGSAPTVPRYVIDGWIARLCGLLKTGDEGETVTVR